MRTFWKLAWVQAKLYLREPLSVFFTLLLGPLLLLLFGLIFGNEPQEMFGGYGHLDISVPTYTAVIIGITALTAVPIVAATRREMGVLRRFAATPLRPLTYFLTDILAPYIFTLAGIGVLFLMGRLVYHVRFEGSWLSVMAGVCLSTLALFALGYTLAGLAPSARAAIVIGNVIIIPMNILSGALVPMEVLPEKVETIARFLPLTYAVSLLRGLWTGHSWSQHLTDVSVLIGLLLVGSLVTALTFKWE